MKLKKLMKKTILISKMLASRQVSCEIQSGVFLSSVEDMIEDQLAWDDEDPDKDIDFSTSQFWITTDGGVDPIGIDDDAELLEMFPDLKKIR